MKNHDSNVFLYDSSAPIGNSYHGCTTERCAGMYLLVHTGMFISMFGYLKQLQSSKVTAVADKISRCRSVHWKFCLFPTMCSKKTKVHWESQASPSLCMHVIRRETSVSFFWFFEKFLAKPEKEPWLQNWQIQQFHSDISYIQDNIQYFLFLNSHFCVCSCPVPLCGVY